MNNLNHEQNIDEAVAQSAVDLHKLADMYRRHGKHAEAETVEHSILIDAIDAPPQRESHFVWLKKPPESK